MMSELDLPSLGRVVIGFLSTAAIGIGAIVALKRVLPKLFQRPLQQGAIRLVERADITPSLRVQLIQIEGRRIVIAEGKSGLGLMILPESSSSSAP